MRLLRGQTRRASRMSGDLPDELHKLRHLEYRKTVRLQTLRTIVNYTFISKESRCDDSGSWNVAEVLFIDQGVSARGAAARRKIKHLNLVKAIRRENSCARSQCQMFPIYTFFSRRENITSRAWRKLWILPFLNKHYLYRFISFQAKGQRATIQKAKHQ